MREIRKIIYVVGLAVLSVIVILAMATASIDQTPIVNTTVPSNSTPTTTHPSEIQEGEYGDNWVQTLPELTRNFPIPPECQTTEDAGFIVHEDNSIEIAVPGGCVFDPDTLEWRKPIPVE